MNITPVPIYAGNYARGRKGHRPDAVVIHRSEGSLASMTSWFNNPDSMVSAHYGVSRAGSVVQYVDDADTAWHAGRLLHPTAELVLARPGTNPNLYTIGIEHEGYATSEPTPEQMAASAALLALLAHRHGIPLDRRHVIRHEEIRSDKTCPGKLDVDELLRLAMPPAPVPRPGARRWSAYFGEWLILTEYKSDSNWRFLPESKLRRLGLQATVPWSQMPREP